MISAQNAFKKTVETWQKDKIDEAAALALAAIEEHVAQFAARGLLGFEWECPSLQIAEFVSYVLMKNGYATCVQESKVSISWGFSPVPGPHSSIIINDGTFRK